MKLIKNLPLLLPLLGIIVGTFSGCAAKFHSPQANFVSKTKADGMLRRLFE